MKPPFLVETQPESVGRKGTPNNVFDSVVILSPFHWNFRGDMWQTTHHIAREFSRLYPTVLVEPAVQWNIRNEHYRGHRLLHSIFGLRTRSPQENLVVFHRRGLPLGRFGLIRDFDLRRNAWALRKFLSGCGLRRTLLWHSFPYWSEQVMQAVDYALLVYHCLDHSDREEELRLIRRSDVVFCVSETLVQRHRALNPHTYLLPNGVDLQLFSPRRGSRRPSDLPNKGRLIGFVGSINCHLDLKLLLRVAHAFPKDYLILVGSVMGNGTAPIGSQKRALVELQAMKNVRMLGFKSIEHVPAYLNAFDVCLIPLLQNDFNRERDPLKFYQYSALGKPIVSTPVPAAERHSDVCYVAASPREFIHRISEALSEPISAGLSEERIVLSRSYSWESIVARACELLSHVGESQTNSHTVGTTTAPGAEKRAGNP